MWAPLFLLDSEAYFSRGFHFSLNLQESHSFLFDTIQKCAAYRVKNGLAQNMVMWFMWPLKSKGTQVNFATFSVLVCLSHFRGSFQTCSYCWTSRNFNNMTGPRIFIGFISYHYHTYILLEYLISSYILLIRSHYFELIVGSMIFCRIFP